MKLPWFKRRGMFYIPTTFIGWIILFFAIAYAIYSFIDINNTQHSNSDVLMNWVFSLLIISAVYSLIAYITIEIAKK